MLTKKSFEGNGKGLFRIVLALMAAGIALMAVGCPVDTGGGTTYTVSYDVGEGSGIAPAGQSVVKGAVIYLPGQGQMTAPAKKTFNGWRSGSQNYAAGDSFTVTASVTFTAQWAETDSSPGDTPSDNTPGSALRAVPTAASTTVVPKILDSYTEAGKNYYLIDVGYIYNTYVSTIMLCHYNGVTPIGLSKTTLNSTTVTEALTETVSESVTVSNTQNVTVGLEVGAKIGMGEFWKMLFPEQAEFSAKLKTEWTGSWTNSSTDTKSKETSVSRAETAAEQFTVAFTVGEHGEPAGYYRYALYATSDVYFVVTTSADNQTLLGWETVVCARDSSYLPHFDYAADGKFDNAPVTGKIDFSEDFYKTLALPTVSTTYTVTYEPNGGTGTIPTAQTVNAGLSVTVKNPGGLTRAGHSFMGWTANAAGLGTTYKPGDSYTPLQDVTLYAQWTESLPYLYDLVVSEGTMRSDRAYVRNSPTDNGTGSYLDANRQAGGADLYIGYLREARASNHNAIAEIKMLKGQNAAAPAGWTKINVDLNKGTKKHDAYLYLAYRRVNASDTQAIDFVGAYDNVNANNGHDIAGMSDYSWVTWYGSTAWADLNNGAGGNYIYLTVHKKAFVWSAE